MTACGSGSTATTTAASKAATAAAATTKAAAATMAAATTKAAAATTKAAATTAAAAASSKDKVTVTFWDENAGDERTKYYKKIIEDFEKENPNIHIEYLGLASGDALSKYRTALAAGETPDVGGINNSWAATVIGQGHCVALDDMYTKWDTAGNVDKGAIQVSRTYNKDGKLYMMPTSNNFICLWTNDKLFSKAGLQAPKTWDEFFSDVEKLTDKNAGQFGYTIRGGGASPQVLIDFIYSYLGTNEVFDSNGKCTINSDKAVEFVQKYLALYGKYTPESDITAGYKEISANFDSGVAAMFTHNLGSYGSHVTAFKGTTGFTCNPLPTASNGKYVNFGGALTGLSMFDTCKNKEAAWKWISYMCDHKANSYWNQSIGQLPINKSCFQDDWIKGMQHIQCAIKTTEQSNCLTYTSPSYLPEWGNINSTYIEPAVQSVMSGNMTAKEMLDMWAGYLNDAYANYKK
jgi:multiple sugar transport system substrate-binding protein